MHTPVEAAKEIGGLVVGALRSSSQGQHGKQSATSHSLYESGFKVNEHIIITRKRMNSWNREEAVLKTKLFLSARLGILFN